MNEPTLLINTSDLLDGMNRLERENSRLRQSLVAAVIGIPALISMTAMAQSLLTRPVTVVVRPFGNEAAFSSPADGNAAVPADRTRFPADRVAALEDANRKLLDGIREAGRMLDGVGVPAMRAQVFPAAPEKLTAR